LDQRETNQYGMKVMGALEGKIAIVTGGTSGIGARTAELFVDEGAMVVVAGRRSNAGTALASRLGKGTNFIRTDVGSEADIKALIEGTVQRLGRLDCLFNNAGYGIPHRSIADLDVAEYDAITAVLVRGVMLGMKYASQAMLRQRSGSIINTGSVAAYRSGYGSQTYSMAKAAVVHATHCVAAELGESGIRVNSISPGFIVTGIFGKGAGIDSDTADRHTAAVAERSAKAQPIPRAGLVDDIAQAALYLASDASSFVNGHDLVVDGGLITGARFSAGTAARRELNEALQQGLRG
jgi:NAD(P)-dependent dehydrogenase (short-subunit alcohol dehydrogenase family)